MCDFDTQKDADNYLKTHSELSRREFTTLATGAGMAMMMPSIASAQSISERDVEIRTPDGVADCHFAYPSTGSHAAVLVWPDILALRPAFREMGRRLAREGYAVLTVNPFYRDARSPWLAWAPALDNRKSGTWCSLWPGTLTQTLTSLMPGRLPLGSMSRMKWTPVRALVPPATAWVDRW